MFCSRNDSVRIRPGTDSLLKKITSTVSNTLGSGVKTVDNQIGEVAEDSPKLNLKNITPQMWFMLLIFVVVVSAMCKCKYNEKTGTKKEGSYFYY